ncbi:hypothetical protein [Streptomyces sp. NPDC088923]|uniref:hypothetical protein n=1 Tax=Streptomyces sp. NPDC088923 TaxID=3365913 RepID=UPI003807AF7E
MSEQPELLARAEQQITRLLAERARVPEPGLPVDLLEVALVGGLETVLHLLRSSRYPLPAGRRAELLRRARDASRRSAMAVGCLLSEETAAERDGDCLLSEETAAERDGDDAWM